MKSENQSLLASILTALAGAWLLITPVFISMTGVALTSILVVGALVALSGLAQIFYSDNALPSWFNAAAAVYAFISAFAFTMSSNATWNLAITAVVLFVLAIWDGVEVQHVHHEHREHRTPIG